MNFSKTVKILYIIFTGKILILRSIFICKYLQTPTNLFLASLALADLLITSFLPFYAVSAYLNLLSYMFSLMTSNLIQFKSIEIKDQLMTIKIAKLNQMITHNHRISEQIFELHQKSCISGTPEIFCIHDTIKSLHLCSITISDEMSLCHFRISSDCDQFWEVKVYLIFGDSWRYLIYGNGVVSRLFLEFFHTRFPFWVRGTLIQPMGRGIHPYSWQGSTLMWMMAGEGTPAWTGWGTNSWNWMGVPAQI